jgi:hypothetical protein
MKLKKILFLIVFTAVIFCSSFYIQKWIMKSKTDTPSSVNTSSSNLNSNPSISPIVNENKPLTTIPSEAPTSTTVPTISVQPTTAAGDGSEKTAGNPTTTPTPSYTPTPEQTGETDVITTMHQMSNGFIVAVDGMIWGVADMTKNKISELTEVINKNDYNHKSILLQILKRWNNGDFSKIVEDHNTLWGYLDGSVGRAERPNEKIVNGKYPDFK